MAVKIFQPNENRDEIKQQFRDGVPLEEILTKYPVARRTAYRYKKEVEDEKTNPPAPASGVKKTVSASAAVPGVAKESFTPQGTPVNPPPGAPAGEYLTVGTLRMPLLDWGYSKTRNLFIVADTFEIAKQEYGFPQTMKVGDFMAELCQAFRIMRGWDVIGIGVYPVKIVKGTEVEANDTRRNHGSEAR